MLILASSTIISGVTPLPAPPEKTRYSYTYHYGTIEYKPGERGHGYNWGHYIVDENCKPVYITKDPKNFRRLTRKFRIRQRNDD